MLEQESLFAEQCPKGGDETCAKKTSGKKRAASGTKPAFKRRRKAKREVEDYYALLGISEDAALDGIKRGYLEKVRQYPPESHPEEFQKIRKAYDTLRDPELRKEYNILRQYGESIEDLLQEATGGNITSQAVKLLERAVAIDPQHIKARLALAYAYIWRGKELHFAAQFSELKKIVGPDKWLIMWRDKIKMLLNVLRADEAFAELQKFKEANPNAVRKFWDLYLDVYSAVEREDQLIHEVEEQIRAIEAPSAADIELYAAWINFAEALDDRGKCAKAQTAARKFIKNFRNPEDISVIVGILMEEYHRCRKDVDFTGAKIFVDLALAIDKNNKELQQYSLQMQTVMLLMSEIDRACGDRKIFPPVLIDILRWLAEEFEAMEDMLDEMTYMFPMGFLEELQGMAEEYAAGIIYLKKVSDHLPLLPTALGGAV